MAGVGRARAGGPKTMDLRPRQTLTAKDGSKVRMSGDKDGLTDGQKAIIKSDVREMLPAQAHAAQAKVQTRAQDFYAKGQAIQATASSLGVISSSGADVSAATNQAEAQLLDNAARINSTMASNSDAQVRDRQQSGEAVFKLICDLDAQVASTAEHIVRNI